MNKRIIHSEHIFLFPFTWQVFHGKYGDKSFESRTNIEYIKKLFNNDWDMQIFKSNQTIDYNEYIYFFPSVRSALYTAKSKGEVVYNFKYRTIKKGISKYIIEVDGRQYTLDIEDIKLRIYKTGIGILSFHLRNDTYSKPSQILEINNFGRRVYPPYLPLDLVKNHLLAEKLILHINDHHIIEEDFNKTYSTSPIQVSNTIMRLLGSKFSTILGDLKRGDIYIQPVIDDRMFVMCWYLNPTLAKELSTIDSDSKYGYEDNLFWYQYLFVDGNGLSCKNDNLLSHQLKIHTYDRWVGAGALYGVTRYSFMSIGTHKSATYRVYDQLVCLTLVQRASALHFSNEVSRIAVLSKMQLVTSIRSLYKYHILFINHLYFREVTADNQGIELYDKLIDQLKILSDINMLDAEIDRINEYATLLAQESGQKRSNAITIIGASLVIPTFVTGFFGINIFPEKLTTWWLHKEFKLWLNSYVLLPVFAIILLCSLRPRRSIGYILFITLIGALTLTSIYIAYQFGTGL